ncbi:MAG: acyl-CoA thioesterase [Acidimicrobiia bacterium]|nr:acyl-CoA thioesterase [Acidimicrobiia bacterium]
MIEGFAVVERIRVQWGDMDALGHVNNARFFTWFETARIAYFREIGFVADRSGGVGPILAHTSCDFLAPVEYPAEILAGARVTRLGKASFHHEYLVVPSDRPAHPVAKGTGVIVLYDYETETSVPLPDDFRARIRVLDGLD